MEYKSLLKGVLDWNPLQIVQKNFHRLDALTTIEVWETLLAMLGHTTMFLRMLIVRSSSYHRFSDRCEWFLYIKSSKSLPWLWIHTSVYLYGISLPEFLIDILEDHRCKSRWNRLLSELLVCLMWMRSFFYLLAGSKIFIPYLLDWCLYIYTSVLHEIFFTYCW